MMFNYILAALLAGPVYSQSMSPRWGSASAVFGTTLYVHGGRTPIDQDIQNYNGKPSSDLLSLDLSSSFDLSSPPWKTFDAQFDALAFHSLTLLSPGYGLFFGGETNSSYPLPERNDSTGFLTINSSSPTFQKAADNSQNEPLRTEFHASASQGGRAYIFGGQTIDGARIIPDSYVYDQTSGFTALPTSSAPPPTYGHAALPLSSGAIILFGGFTEVSSAASLSTIYILNTTSSTPSWSNTSTSGNSPPSRRNFATADLGSDKFLIHGGTTDGGPSPQNFLSDGWILDASTNPMTWTSVPNIDQLGDKSDHVAVAVGSQVFFAFGWSSNQAANTSLALFDTSNNGFLLNFAAPTPTPTAAGTSNAFPSATSGLPSQSLTTIASASFTSSTVAGEPTTAGQPTSNPIGSSSNVNQHSLAIALATVFGVLALVGVAGAATYITIKRREERDGGAWYRIDKEDPSQTNNLEAGGDGATAAAATRPGETNEEDPSPHNALPPEKVRMLGGTPVSRPQSRFGGALALLAGGWLGSRDRDGRRNRTDMFANEDEDADEHSFRAVPSARPRPRREVSGWSNGSSVSNWYGAGSRKRWGWDTFNRSFLGSKRDLTAGNVNEDGGTGLGEKEIPWWDSEAVPLDPFGDDMALRAREEVEDLNRFSQETQGPSHGSTSADGGGGILSELGTNNVSGLAAVGVGMPAERPRGGMRLVDPFSSESVERAYSFPYMDPTSSSGVGPDTPHVRSDLLHVAPAQGVGPAVLAAVAADTPRSRASTVASGRLVDSSSSHSGGSTHAVSGHASQGLLTTSILGGLSAPVSNAPIKRSDSWWSRFSRGSASGRGPRSPGPGSGANTPGPGDIIEFRDPQPAPKLLPIKEGSGGSGSVSVNREGSDGSNATTTSHRRPQSMASVGTGHTADSEAIERMAGMDVVQRGGTMSSVNTSESSEELPGSEEGYRIPDSHQDALSVVMESSDGGGLSGSSRSVLPERSELVRSPVSLGSSADPDMDLLTRPPPYPMAGNGISDSSGTSSGASSSGRVSERIRAWEDRRQPQDRRSREERRGSTYGLAPRASLYIANPETEGS